MRRDVFQAIADPTRRQIIGLLAKQSMNLNSVSENFGISRPAISKHIRILSECGLVMVKQTGRERYCTVDWKKLKQVADWTRAAIMQLRIQNADREPLTKPVQVEATFYRDRRVGDLNNYMAALADALEEAGVLENDRLIQSWDRTRLAIDRENPRVELTVAPFAAEAL